MISKQTTLDLNGPILSFVQQPVGVASTGVGVGLTGGGSIIFIGIATATFPSLGTITNSASNTGYATYRWYEVGIGALSDSNYVTGSATTSLTITNLITPSDNNRQFYLTADYVPSAYGLPGVAVTIGSGRSTGNALIEPVNSNIITATVYPLLEIVTQPPNRQALLNTNTTFTVDASLTDTSFVSGLNYQWVLNGQNISDGVITSVGSATEVDVTYNNDSSITLPSDANNVVVTVAGASGGSGGSDSGGGGGGGGNGRSGKFAYANGERTLSFRIGRRGNGGGSGNFNALGPGGASSVAAGGRGGGAGGSGWSGGGGGGGGSSGVYDSTVNNYTIVSGAGGGGGGGSLNRGASGGATAGVFSASSGSFAISAGGAGADKGGDGGGGGGGGGGATGGGGGGAGQDNESGGGGGNSGGSKYNTNITTYQDQWDNGGDGYVNLKFTTQTTIPGVTVVTQKNTTVSGTKTPVLTIKSDTVGIQTVRCIISNSIATNSPIFSDIVNFVTVSSAEQYNINVEAIGINNTATISSINLFNGDYEFSTSGRDILAGVTTKFYSFYAPDRDINIEMDLYGGKGSDVGSYKGGEGGFSRVRFTILRDTEYVIAGLTESINSPFIYRKGQLIACVGGGGNAGNGGNGGFGGGIGVAGQNGFGRGGGTAGLVNVPGTLTTNGVFGSLFTLIPVSPDTKAIAPLGGRTLSCTKGVYWKEQGINSCLDVGTQQFRLSDGTVVINTKLITRGFKSGYNIIETAGEGIGNGGGNGGNGATGGSGGDSGGGAGGSGYTDGSITLISTGLGGNAGTGRVTIRPVS